jgi:hypothetical protein
MEKKDIEKEIKELVIQHLRTHGLSYGSAHPIADTIWRRFGEESYKVYKDELVCKEVLRDLTLDLINGLTSFVTALTKDVRQLRPLQ